MAGQFKACFLPIFVYIGVMMENVKKIAILLTQKRRSNEQS
jgi:hypothetical protein